METIYEFCLKLYDRKKELQDYKFSVAKDQEVEAGVYNFNTGDTITLIEK